jgi:hypothetical protein
VQGVEDGSITRLPINHDPDTPESYRMMRMWIDECIDDHGTWTPYKQDLSSSPPARLLKVRRASGSYAVSLVECGDGQDTEYVALSYCWGGEQVHKTTKASLQATKGVLSFEHLPATIQDAVKVTFQLGYDHIWIDSLCIVQDDDAEITKEIAKMPSIYSNAVVTIAAAKAQSVAEGFLHQRVAPPLITNMQLLGATGAPQYVSLVETTGSDNQTMPLNGRAWALQESLLSARVLEFRPL